MQTMEKQLEICHIGLFKKVKAILSRNIVNTYESGVLESLLVDKDREYIISNDIEVYFPFYSIDAYKVCASIRFYSHNEEIKLYVSSITIKEMPNGKTIVIDNGDVDNELELNGTVNYDVIKKFKKNTIRGMHENQDKLIKLILDKENPEIKRLKEMDKSFYALEIKDSINLTSEDGYVYYYKIVITREEDNQSYLYIYIDKCMSENDMVLSCKLDI